MKLYDISSPIQAGIAVWPGDTPYRRDEILKMSAGASVNLSTVHISLHTGTHADAPSHFADGAAAIDAVDLSRYLGPALLVTVAVDGAIRPVDLEDCLARRPERLLVRCNPSIDPNSFPASFVSFSPEAARRAGSMGVRLVGTDAPSVDPFESKDLPAHHAFQSYGTAILENLFLRDVPDGEYELIALPLRIIGGDASPVRALLRG